MLRRSAVSTGRLFDQGGHVELIHFPSDPTFNIYLRTKILHGPIFVIIFEMFYSPYGIETEKCLSA